MATTERYTVEIEFTDRGTLRVFETGGRTIGEFGRAVENAGRKVDSASSFFASFSGAIVTLNQGLDLAGRALRGAESAAEFFLQGIGRGGQLDDMSKRLGVSVEALSSFELGAKTAGVSLDSLGTGIQVLSRNMVEAASGSKEYVDIFKALGVSVTDASGALKSGEQVLLEISETFAGAQDGAAKTGLAMQALGRSGALLIPFLNEGADGLQKWQELSERLGLNLSTELAASMDSVGDSFEVLNAALDGALQQLAVGMAPALQRAGDAAVDFVASLGIADGRLQDLGAAIGDFVETGVRGLIDAIDRLSDRASDVGFVQALLEEFQRAGPAVSGIAADVGSTLGEAAATAFKESFRIDWGALISGSLGGAEVTLDEIEAQLQERARPIEIGLDVSLSSVANPDSIIRGFQDLEQAELAAAQAGAALHAQQSTLGTVIGQNADGTLVYAESTDELKRQLTALKIPTDQAGDAAKKTADFLKGLATEAQKLGAVGSLWEEAAAGALSYQEAALLVAVAEKTAGEAGATAAAQQQALNNARQATVNTLREQTALQVDENAALEASIEAFDQAFAATGDVEQATIAASAAQEDYATRALAAAAGNIEAGEAAIAARDSYRALIEAQREQQQIAGGQAQLTVLREQLAIHQQMAAGILSQVEGERALAVAAAGVSPVLRDVAGQQFDIEQAIEEAELGYLHLGDTIKDSFGQVFDALIAGTLDLGDSLESLGLAIGKRFFESMLDSKLSDFDPVVKANFLDLGSFGEGVFGDLFSGAKDAASGIGDFFGFGGGGGGGGSALEIIGQNADGSFIFADGSTGFGQSRPGGGGSGGSSFGGSAVDVGLGALSGYGTAHALGQYVFRSGATGLTGLAARGAEPGIFSNASAINDVGGAVIGAVLSYFIGPAGGAIGGAIASAIGAWIMSGITRDTLRGGGIGNGVGIVQDIFDPADILGSLLGIPTLGTAFRRAGESILDESKIFGHEKGLQGLLGDFTRDQNKRLGIDDNYRTGGATALERGFTQAQVDQVLGASASIFSNLAKGELPEDAGRFFEEMGQGMAEFLSRGLAEGLEFDELFASLAAFAEESGLTAVTAIKGLDAVFEQSQAAALEFGKLDPFAATQQGAEEYAQALVGVTALFETTLPAGVHLGSLALQSMEKDGVKLFEKLDHEGRETLLNLTEDTELFQETVEKLKLQGFSIDTEEFEARLQAITESAEFLGENLGQVFNFDNAAVGVQAVFQGLGQTVLREFQQVSLKQLFDTTDIAASFEPVFAVLDRIDEFDLTTATGSQEFMALLVPALAEGKANLEEYIPVLQLMADNWKEIQAIVEEAFAPDEFEKAALIVEGVFGGLGSTLASAIDTGLAVLNDGGTWEQAVSAFNGVFGAGVKSAFQDAIFAAIVDTAFIQPLIDTYSPAFQYVVAAGLIHGFDDPRVKAAFADVMNDFQSDAEKLGLAVFEAKVDSEGLTSSIEKAFNDAVPLTVEWANSLRGTLNSAVDGMFDVLRDGGSYADALAAWESGIADATEGGVTEGIIKALITAAVIEPFIESWSPAIQFYVAAGLEHGFDDPRVKNLGRDLFGPDSEMFRQLKALGPAALDIIGYFFFDGAPPEGFDQQGHLIPRRTIVPVEYVAVDGTGTRRFPWEEEADALAEANDQGIESITSFGGALDDTTPSVGALGGAAEAAAAALSALGDVGTPASSAGRSLPGAAMGGSFGPGAAFIVGEAGPELVVNGTGGGTTVVPLDVATANALMGGGMAGYASGLPFPPRSAPGGGGSGRGGDGQTRPFPGGPGSGWGPGGPIVSDPNDPRHPDYQPPGGSGSGSNDALIVTLEIRAAFEEFLQSGDFATFTEQFEDGVNQAVASGVMDALLESGPLASAIDKFNSVLSKEIEKAWRDGSLSDEEIETIKTKLGELSGPIKDIVERLGPELADLFADLGLIETVGSELRDALGSAFRDFARTGDLDTAGAAVRDAFYAAALDGIVAALLLEGPLAEAIDGAAEDFHDAFEEAMADGVISEEETARLAALAGQLGEDLLAQFALLDPAFAALFDGMRDRATEAAQESANLIGGALRQALRDPRNFSYETFTTALKASIFESVAGGLIDAFINAAVIQGALAPMLAVISEIFEQIGSEQISVAEANGAIAEQIALMLGVLDSEAFREGIETLLEGVKGLADQLLEFPSTAADIERSASAVSDAVTQAEKDVCEGTCGLREETIDLGRTILNAGGRVGDVQDIVYREIPRFAEGGVVTSPMVAHVGEVPEAIIPLNRLGGGDDARAARMERLLERLVEKDGQPLQATIKIGESEFIDVLVTAHRTARTAGIDITGGE